MALYIYSAYNRYYAEKKDVRTNGFAALVEEAIAKDKELIYFSEEEAHNLTDGFSLPALKVIHLWM